MGMLMWGLAQRHGWGCMQSESKGFSWLRRAAEMALGDLESAKGSGMDRSAVKVRHLAIHHQYYSHIWNQSEMVLAIYEVGQSFFRGWGVEKDKKMGVVRKILLR
jgi:hypothetical protein